jgi:hypothetical protein
MYADLENELRIEEAKLAEMQKEFNNGEPEAPGCELPEALTASRRCAPSRALS